MPKYHVLQLPTITSNSNQSTNQPTNQSTNQPLNQLINQPSKQLTNYKNKQTKTKHEQKDIQSCLQTFANKMKLLKHSTDPVQRPRIVVHRR